VTSLKKRNNSWRSQTFRKSPLELEDGLLVVALEGNVLLNSKFIDFILVFSKNPAVHLLESFWKFMKHYLLPTDALTITLVWPYLHC